MSMRFPLLALCLLTLSACGDGDTDPKDTGVTDTGSGPDDTGGHSGGLSHASDIQPIWDTNCGGCHLAGGSSGDLALDDGYATLVGVASSQVPAMERVHATSTADSYLWYKLQGTQDEVGGTGSQMPQGAQLSEIGRAHV